jgi:hypothetical protein
VIDAATGVATLVGLVDSPGLSGIAFVFDLDDIDGDGVNNEDDFCPGTVIPECDADDVLGSNRWALVDGDFAFDTTGTKGKGSERSYSTADTAGCSCDQIIAICGYGTGHGKSGCSNGVMDLWTGLFDQEGEAPLQCR